jgi:uncharacterized protein YacL
MADIKTLVEQIEDIASNQVKIRIGEMMTFYEMITKSNNMNKTSSNGDLGMFYIVIAFMIFIIFCYITYLIYSDKKNNLFEPNKKNKTEKEIKHNNKNNHKSKDKIYDRFEESCKYKLY